MAVMGGVGGWGGRGGGGKGGGRRRLSAGRKCTRIVRHCGTHGQACNAIRGIACRLLKPFSARAYEARKACTARHAMQSGHCMEAKCARL